MDRDDLIRRSTALAGSALAGFLLARRIERTAPASASGPGAGGMLPAVRHAVLERPAVRVASLLNPEADPHGPLGQKLQGVEAHDVAGAGPRGTVKAYLYRPTGLTAEDPMPAMLWLHGGESLLAHPFQDHEICRRLAEEAGIVVVAPTCRACLRRSFPNAVQDSYAVLAWMEEQADALGLERDRFGIGGISGGAGLAAAVAQAAQDRGGPRILFQVLRSPVLGETSPGARLQEPYGYALQRHDLFGLPPAWTGWGWRERCRQEAAAYTRRLQEAGTSVATSEVEAVHSVDPAVHDFTGEMICAVRNALHRY